MKRPKIKLEAVLIVDGSFQETVFFSKRDLGAMLGGIEFAQPDALKLKRKLKRLIKRWHDEQEVSK